MATVTTALKAGMKTSTGPLIWVGLKAILDVPVDGLANWVKSRFTDHSAALPKTIAAANDRAWQAVGLAMAGDTLLGRIKGLFRDGDMKAVQAQIRAFVTDADTGLDGQPAGLRARACDELNRLQRAGRLGANDIYFESLDLTRFGSTAKVADDAIRAVQCIADDLKADAPHLAQVLTLAPPGGGTPLLAAAFAYFLRRQIATHAELARALTHDRLGLLSQKQQAGFANLEQALADRFDTLFETLGGWFATTDATLDAILAELQQFRDANQVATKPESPLRVSVTNEAELQRLRKLRDRLRDQPAELVDAELQSLLGDGLAAAGQFADAETAHAAAAGAAMESADTQAEADAAYKQFKDSCELKAWDAALAALNRAVAVDGKRFRPVPKHYAIDGILGAGAFGVVLKCRNTISFDDDGNEEVCAVKTFRETDLDRPLKDIFGEANMLKAVHHDGIIRVLDHGFADVDGQARPFLAMEYFPGVTLEDHLARHGKLSLADFLAVFGRIAAALHAAHTGRRVVIHRDLKPANVMVLRADGAWVVKVIDFGLAVKSAVRTTSLSVPHSLRATRDKSVAGTIKYAAPEQLGEKAFPVGPWSDVFAFGKTALEALLGTVQPTPKHWKQLPESLSDALARCVDEEFDARNPNEGRYHGFGPILAALAAGERRVVSAPVIPAPLPPATPVAPAKPASPPADTVKLAPKVEVEVVIPQVPVIPPSEPVMWRIVCPNAACVASLKFKPADAGKSGTCNKCKTRLVLPKAWGEPAVRSMQAGDKHEITLPGGVTMAFAWCPRGTFLMGSPASEEERQNDEQQHEVTLTKGFWMGIHPVTQAQYQAVMGKNPSHFKGDTLPVEQVSWDDAVAYCVALKGKTGIELRLPTEAEWEYACRAGTTTEYHSGDGEGALMAVGWFSGNGGAETHPVGQLKANEWGLHDMHGNVWDWCADWCDEGYYAKSPKEDSTGPESGSFRVSRGGSWFRNSRRCRAACRNGYAPGVRGNDLGFRLAAVPSGE